MPVMGGAEAAGHMRALGYKKDIIIFTGCLDPDVEALMAHSISLIIEKPLSLVQVKKIVEGLLQHRNPCMFVVVILFVGYNFLGIIVGGANSIFCQRSLGAKSFSSPRSAPAVPLTAASVSAANGSSGGSMSKSAFNPSIGGSSTQQQRQQTTPSAGATTTTATTATAGRRHHCLVVDDVVSNRKMVASILKKLGHTVTMAEDGLQALAIFDKALSGNQPFDFIFLDFVMPSKPVIAMCALTSSTCSACGT